MEDFRFTPPEINTDKIRIAYEELVQSHANLIKARRRVRLVRTAEIAVVVLGGVTLYRHRKNRNK